MVLVNMKFMYDFFLKCGLHFLLLYQTIFYVLGCCVNYALSTRYS